MARKIRLTADGIVVEQQVESPLSGRTEWVRIDEVNWEEAPTDHLDWRVSTVNPVFDDERKTLKEVVFEVDIGAPMQAADLPSSEEIFAGDDGEVRIRIRDGQVSLTGQGTAKRHLVVYAKHLVEEGRIGKDDLPIPSGWKRFLISTKPEDRQGKRMESPVELAEDVHLETNMSRESIEKRILELYEKFGR